MEPEVWTTDEVAKRLRCGRAAVLSLIHRGKLFAVLTGRRYRIPDAALQTFLGQRSELRVFPEADR